MIVGTGSGARKDKTGHNCICDLKETSLLSRSRVCGLKCLTQGTRL